MNQNLSYGWWFCTKTLPQFHREIVITLSRVLIDAGNYILINIYVVPVYQTFFGHGKFMDPNLSCENCLVCTKLFSNRDL